MYRDVLFSDDARKGLIRGIDILANAVGSTLGPRGRNVVFHNKYTGIHVTKDGVTVAKNVRLEDNHEAMGVEMVKQVAEKTADLAGDGTTTATVLAQSLIKHGNRSIVAGANPIDIKRGMDKALKDIVEGIKVNSKPIKLDKTTLFQVASISANNDEEVGQIIADAFVTVGEEGAISIEEAKGFDTYLDIVQGFQLDKGYLSPYFVTDADTMQTIFDNVKIVICKDKITEAVELNPLIEKSKGYNLLLICDDISTEALAALVYAKLRGGFSIAAIKSPFYGLKKEESLDDLAVILGTRPLSKELGYPIKSFELSLAGSAEKCVITKNSTLIVNGHGKKSTVDSHVDRLKVLRENETNKMSKDRLSERIAKLTTGVAVLYVGAASEVEMKEKKDRIEDAKEAVSSSLKEGIVEGGGVCLVKIAKSLKNTYKGDEAIGYQVVLDACKEPLNRMALNSGKSSSEVIYNEIITSGKGYDFKNEEYCDMFEKGIIDPAMVTRVAIENAVSVAGMVLITDCALVNIGDMSEGMPEYFIN